ncbi:MAG: class I SAM-dependent methyltransferase [Myxococcota bacterium]
MEQLTTRGGSRCAVCEQASAEPRIELGDFTLFHCPGCGSWSSDARFRDASVSFEPAAYFSNPDADRARWEDLLARRERAGLSTGSVLDVGCGNGAFLGFVRERLPTATRAGIELDPGRVAQARGGDPDAAIEEGDALDCVLRLEGSFDLITLWDVFEHVEAPGRLLEALARRLAPGGWIYLQTIHEQSFVPLVGRTLHRLSGGRLTQAVRRTHEAHHLAFFTRQALDALTRRAGLVRRDLWWGRLARDRMDGPAWLTAATATFLWLENQLGNGLFVNLVLEAGSPGAPGSSPAPVPGAGRGSG